MEKATPSKFWEPGLSIFTKELCQEEKGRLVPLKKALKSTTDLAEKNRIRKEMSEIKTEFKTKRETAKYGLFMTQ